MKIERSLRIIEKNFKRRKWIYWVLLISLFNIWNILTKYKKRYKKYVSLPYDISKKYYVPLKSFEKTTFHAPIMSIIINFNWIIKKKRLTRSRQWNSPIKKISNEPKLILSKIYRSRRIRTLILIWENEKKKEIVEFA